MNAAIAVSSTPRPTSRPFARTAFWKRDATDGSVGGVRNVTTSQLAEVTAIVMSIRSQGRISGKPNCSTSATTSDTPMPVSSVQALIRIQNHRRRNTEPEPAPMRSMRSNAAFALRRCGAIQQARRSRNSIDARPTQMSSRSAACGRTKRFQKSFTR